MQHLQYEMEMQQITILLHHLHAKTLLGLALSILIRTYQLWAGFSDPILLDTQPCPWVPGCWLLQIQWTLQTHQIQIKDDGWMVPAIRRFDIHLMDAITELQLTTTQLTQINACRMFLQVTTLAEITDHTGTVLLPQAFLLPKTDQPNGLANISSSLLDWPAVHLPSKKCWALCTCTIRMLFTGAIDGNRLNHPLGPWTEHFNLFRYWKWRVSPQGSLLYQQAAGSPTRAAIQIQSN